MASRNLSRLISGSSCSRVTISGGRRLPIRTFSDIPQEPKQPSDHARQEAPHLEIPAQPRRNDSADATPKPRTRSPSQDNSQSQSQSPTRSPISGEGSSAPWSRQMRQDLVDATASQKKTAIQYPYFVPRNSNGAVPVYSDFKNQKSRNLTLIRNIEGNVNVRTTLSWLETRLTTVILIQALKEDLVATLFPNTPDMRAWNEKLRNNIRVHQNRHIVIQGDRWVNHVHKWLLARGF